MSSHSIDQVQWHLQGVVRILLKSLCDDLFYIRDLGMSDEDQVLVKDVLKSLVEILLKDFDKQVSQGFPLRLEEMPQSFDRWLKYVDSNYHLSHWNLNRIEYCQKRLAKMVSKNKRISKELELGALTQVIQKFIELSERSPSTFYQLGLAAGELCKISQINQLNKFNPATTLITKTVTASVPLFRLLNRDIEALLRIDPALFEDFIGEQLENMGMSVRKVGNTYSSDGGVDLIASPKNSNFPFLLAVQVKHHRKPSTKTGPSPVKDLQTVLTALPFHAGMIVTNTEFTPDAEWWASKSPGKIQLHDISSIREWVSSRYDKTRFRNIPREIQLTPRLNVDVW